MMNLSTGLRSIRVAHQVSTTTRRRKLLKQIYWDRLSRFPELYAAGKTDREIGEALEIPTCYVSLERRSRNLMQNGQKEKAEAILKREADAKKRAFDSLPHLVRLRANHPDDLAFAQAVMGSEGRVSTLTVVGKAYARLDGKNATPMQWLDAANKVLVREGLPVIGRGSWN